MKSLNQKQSLDGYRPATFPSVLKLIAGTHTTNMEAEAIPLTDTPQLASGGMQAPFVFTRVGYIYLPTRDIEAAADWYVDKLGLKLSARFNERGSEIAVFQYPHRNAIALLLVASEDGQPMSIIRNSKPFPVAAINCPDIEHTHKTLIEKGVEADPIQTISEGEAMYFYFRDRDGNLLEAAWSIWDPVDEIKDEFIP